MSICRTTRPRLLTGGMPESEVVGGSEALHDGLLNLKHSLSSCGEACHVQSGSWYCTTWAERKGPSATVRKGIDRILCGFQVPVICISLIPQGRLCISEGLENM